MTKTYTKLFHKILASSIWDEDDKTRIVWITLLAMTDEHGVIVATMNKVARDARVDLDNCRTALDKFMAPDENSTSAAFEGRRLEKVEGGWRMLNHAKYRDMMSQEQRRDYYRQKKREYRQRDKELRYDQTMAEGVRERVNAQEKLEKTKD